MSRARYWNAISGLLCSITNLGLDVGDNEIVEFRYLTMTISGNTEVTLLVWLKFTLITPVRAYLECQTNS